ncbi:MAG TPA: phosphonopyruvate decarboxylase [Pyrinomonadaceae bacterium]|jgi:phosphonopyruvate decarboxylase
MIHPSTFVSKARERGADLYASVPCSFLKPLINYAIDDPEVSYVQLNNEGEAVAFAAGAYLAGKRPAVMFQNSGLGNMINPVASLLYPFRIPLLLICTWRGQPGLGDEPQHELMGKISAQMLSLVEVENEVVAGEEQMAAAALGRAFEHLERTSLPYGLIVPKGTFQSYKLTSPPRERRAAASRVRRKGDGAPSSRRFDLVQVICDVVGAESVIVGTTGLTGREMFAYRDSPNHFYMVGSMGCASSLGLGMAMHLPPEQKVVVVDGDGAALMRLEAMASIGCYRPANLVHVILDNNMHESTGGQQTLSHGVELDGVAAACGYADVVSTSDRAEFGDELEGALRREGPTLIYARTVAGTRDDLPRPTVSPAQVKERLMSHLGVGVRR